MKWKWTLSIRIPIVINKTVTHMQLKKVIAKRRRWYVSGVVPRGALSLSRISLNFVACKKLLS